MLDWLTIAYGDDEAERARCLPERLRVELYPEVYEYGPAWREVSELFTLAEKVADFDDPTDESQSFYRRFTNFHQRALDVSLGWDPPKPPIPDKAVTMWALHDSLEFAARRFESLRGGGFGWCVTFIGLVLSAGMFELAVREKFEEFNDEAAGLVSALRACAAGVTDWE